MDAETVAREYYESRIGSGLGSQFMAVIFDALFAGVLICQLTHWLPNLKHDPKHTRFIVGFGVLAALGTTIFTWANYLTTFVFEFGNFARFASLQDLGWYPLLDILTVIPVQLIFAERSIKVNNRSLIVIFLDTILILGTLTAALGSVVTTRGTTIFTIPHIGGIFLLLWPCICAATHLFLTSSIIFGLLKYRQGLTQSTNIVDRLIYTSLESQLPSTCFAIAVTVTIGVNPKASVVPWIVIVHPKVFIVGCVAMLNSRHTWQKQGKLPSSGRYSSNGAKSSSASSDESAAPNTPNLNLIPLALDRNQSVSKDTDFEAFEAPTGLGFRQEVSVLDPTGRPEFGRSDSDFNSRRQ